MVAGSPSDSAGLALASRVIAGLKSHFGRTARGFVVADMQEDQHLIAFSITFEVYDFYEVIGQTGADVRPISAFQREAEVLFQRGTPFEVVTDPVFENGVWRVTIREIVP